MTLRSGALSADEDGAGIRDVALAGTTMVLRLALVVRDERWGTVPLAICTRAETPDGEGILLTGTARRGRVALSWDLELRLGSGGRVHAGVRMTALRTTRFNRVGLVALLDPALVCGAVGRFEGPDRHGSVRLPELVAPQRVRAGLPAPLHGPFDHLQLRFPSGGGMHLTATGDLFEIEDERNWTDGSFKIYSTPLSLGFPHELEEGAVVEQRLSLALRAARRRRRSPPVRAELRPVGAPLPRVGTLAGHGPRPSHAAAVDALELQHLRVDVAPDPEIDPGARPGTPGTELELAIHLTASEPVGTDRLAAMLDAWAPARLLVFGDPPCTPAWAIERARSAVREAGLICPVIGGTDGHFVDLNRDRPAVDAWDGVVIPMSPQVHGRDDRTIGRSPVGVEAVLRTAHEVLCPAAIHLSPLGMTPRHGPGAVPDDSTELEAHARMAQAGTAAWLVAAVAAALRPGVPVASLTAFAVEGPDSLFDAAGHPVPAARILSLLARHAGRPAWTLTGLPAGVHALGAARGDGTASVWLANPQPAPRAVVLDADVTSTLGDVDARGADVVLGAQALACVRIALPGGRQTAVMPPSTGYRPPVQ